MRKFFHRVKSMVLSHSLVLGAIAVGMAFSNIKDGLPAHRWCKLLYYRTRDNLLYGNSHLKYCGRGKCNCCNASQLLLTSFGLLHAYLLGELDVSAVW